MTKKQNKDKRKDNCFLWFAGLGALSVSAVFGMKIAGDISSIKQQNKEIEKCVSKKNNLEKITGQIISKTREDKIKWWIHSENTLYARAKFSPIKDIYLVKNYKGYELGFGSPESKARINSADYEPLQDFGDVLYDLKLDKYEIPLFGL